MLPIGIRRTKLNAGGKSIYSEVVEMIEKTEENDLGSHDFGTTFDRTYENEKYGKYYFTKDKSKFTVNLVAEVGSEDEGTWLAGYNKNMPASKLPWKDNSPMHRMVIAARCPTNAPKALKQYFVDYLATLDAVRVQDAKEERETGMTYSFVHEWVVSSDKQKGQYGNIILLRLPPTYEIPISSQGASSASIDRPRHTKSKRSKRSKVKVDVDSEMKDDDDTADEAPSAPLPSAKAPEDRKIGDTYDPNLLPEHCGDYFAHEHAKLIQRDIRDEDETLIAPHELCNKLTEGTLFCATVSFETFNYFKSPPPTKTYHIHIEALKILDKGDGITWVYEIPSIPDNTKRDREEEVEKRSSATTALTAFQSPSKKARTSKSF